MAIRVSRVLHAGYVFECGGVKVAFDPIFENPFSRNCYAYPPVEFDLEAIRQEHFDAVFISHYHDDHCSFESLDLLDRKTPIYMFCVFEEMFDLLRELGFSNVHSLSLGEPVTIGGFQITPHRALDADVDSIFQIEASGFKVLNVVDSWIDDETLEILKSQGPWDLVLWPFQTMREIEVLAPTMFSESDGQIPHEWIPQMRELRPKFMIASSCQFRHESWSWYNHALFPITYRGFREQVEAALPEMRVVRLDPGESFEVSDQGLMPATRLPWVSRKDAVPVDYEYEPHRTPMTTAEIATKFSRVSDPMRARVLKYCTSELSKRLSEIGFPQHGYFEKSPRLWRLIIYDHEGRAEDFYYRIHASEGASSVEPLSEKPSDSASWQTEIPLMKLFAALEEGESLTSMYVRVNDFVASPQIEAELDSANILEDPLVRSLYDGVFGSYQKAQLARLIGAR